MCKLNQICKAQFGMIYFIIIFKLMRQTITTVLKACESHCHCTYQPRNIQFNYVLDDRLIKSKENEKPTTSPYSTSQGQNRWLCSNLCNLDDNCYAVGMKQSGGGWMCELFGQLSDSERYVTENGYDVFVDVVTVHSLVTN